jgi:hypothetical protein
MAETKPSEPPVLTRKQTAEFFHRSLRWVDDQVRAGRLRTIMFGGRKGFSREEVERLAREGNAS